MTNGHSDSPAPSMTVFARFYQEQFAPMVRLATLLTGHNEVARDIVQDALISLHEVWGDVRIPTAYLRRSVVNASSGFLRSPRNWRHVPLDDQNPAHEPSLTPRVDHTFAALAVLTPRQRTCVVLKYYEGRTESEIADLVGCAPGSVGPTIHRALDKLRSELGEPHE